MKNRGKLNTGLSGMFAKHIRLKPGEGSIPSPSALIRRLEPKDFHNGFLELIDDFIGCEDLLKNPKKALAIYEDSPYNQVTLVVELEGKIIASASMIMFRKYTLEGKRLGHIYDVTVLHDYQGMGIGSYLVKSLEEIARSNEVVRLILNCNDDKVLYYRRFGFEKTSNYMRKDIGL